MTVAEYWATLTSDAARRVFLLASEATIPVHKIGKGEWFAPVRTRTGKYVLPDDE